MIVINYKNKLYPAKLIGTTGRYISMAAHRSDNPFIIAYNKAFVKLYPDGRRKGIMFECDNPQLVLEKMGATYSGLEYTSIQISNKTVRLFKVNPNIMYINGYGLNLADPAAEMCGFKAGKTLAKSALSHYIMTGKIDPILIKKGVLGYIVTSRPNNSIKIGCTTFTNNDRLALKKAIEMNIAKKKDCEYLSIKK